MFCASCKKPICLKCVSSHNGHNLADFEEHSNKVGKKKDEVLGIIKEQKDENNDAREQAHKDHELASATTDLEYDKLHRILDDSKKRSVDQN